MRRRFVQSLLICIALAVVLCVPGRARAAILPVCENVEAITLVPQAAPSILFADAAEPAPSTACTAPPSDLDGDVKVAAMCDLRGASMIAPPRIHAVGDERIEALPSCERESASAVIGPCPRDASAIHAGQALAPDAALSSDLALPLALSELGPAFLPLRGEARPGALRDVYHPPR